MPTIIRINKKEIGKGKPVFIIAEAGINHNGDVALAKKLIDAAKDAGADAVKFQAFTAEKLVTTHAPMASYQKKNTGSTSSQQTLLKKLELTLPNFEELKMYCDAHGIIFLTAVHSEDVLHAVNKLVPAHKIASGDITNLPFLQKVARTKRPIILSTGMATLAEVQEAVNVLKKEKNHRIILLHCTSNYPCHFDEVNLYAMQTLNKKLNLPVGYSDHTQGFMVGAMAVALGACVLEKHFTLDKNLPGPDHKASLTPHELTEFVHAVRDAHKALGTGIKKPSPNEEEIKKLVRKSIIASSTIEKGETITKDMLIIKRPGTGMPPKFLATIIGKKARKKIQADTLITRSSIM